MILIDGCALSKSLSIYIYVALVFVGIMNAPTLDKQVRDSNVNTGVFTFVFFDKQVRDLLLLFTECGFHCL